MSYSNDFKTALSRTRKWKLAVAEPGTTVVTLDQAVLNALEATCHIPFAQRAGNGFNVNFGMYHMLAKKFRIPGATITMGNVSVNGQPRLPITTARFKDMLADQTGEENMGQYHLWTTLPGGMILDHAILSSLHADGLAEVNEMVPAERFIYGQADELPHGLTYQPMIAGLEFFVASGTIDQEALEYLMGEKFPKQY